MRKLSIGARLTLWYVVIFAVAQAAFGAGMWFILRHHLYDLVDDGLESQMEDVANFLTAQKDVSLPKLREQVAAVYVLEHSGDYFDLSTDQGDLIYRSSFLQAHPGVIASVPHPLRRAFRDRWVEDRPLRFILQTVQVNGRNYFVSLGTVTDDLVETLDLFRTYLLMFAPLVLVLAGLCGHWLSRRALAPVDALVQTARGIRETNLGTRLPKLETGDELERLSDTLNEMLSRIESAFERITEFTADASHELRTPVSLIRTEAELALRRSRSDDEYKEALRHILLEAERTTVLIEQLLSLARADSAREGLNLQPIDLSLALGGTADRWRQVAAARNLSFSSRLERPDLVVMGDAEKLHTLVEILLDNAFKYTYAPGAVSLSLDEGAEAAVITVRDSGPGIAKEEHDKIFERFYRIDKARTRDNGGAGLGLSIAQWIVGQHRGSITVESSPGEGSTFRVYLPLVRHPVPNPQPA